MKKLTLMSIMLSSLFLVSCEVDDSKKGNEGDIPNDIVENGVLGSWGHVVVTPTDLVVAKEWYIEKNRTTIVTKCEFASGIVSAVVQVNSKIQGSFLTLQESESKLVQDGEQTCYAEATKDNSYGLSLASENVLRISRSGTSVEYTRIGTVDNDE